MKTFIIFPIWFIAIAMRPVLPKDHPFKQHHSLSTWTYLGTPVAVVLGAMFWWHLLLVVAFAWRHL